MSLIKQLFFASLFLVALQLPLFVDHYHQFLSGYFEATEDQVEGYEATARQHEYMNVSAMISDHLQNTSPSVRTDALQKQATLSAYDQLKAGLYLFDRGNLLEQYLYILNPYHADFFKNALKNYTPGLPLTPSGLAFGFIVAFSIYAFFSFLYRRLWLRR